MVLIPVNEHAYPYIFAKIFLSNLSLSPSFKLLTAGLCECFIYSSALEKYRIKSLNDKLSDFCDAYLCRTVMKQVLLKVPISISRRNFLLAVVLKWEPVML